MQYIFSFITFVFILNTFSSCSGEQRAKLEVTPTSYGKVDNIMVVADEYTWTTTIGDTFRNYFEALYPVTPQPEPIYQLHYHKPQQFQKAKVLKTHRAIILLGALDDPNDPTSQIIRDVIGEDNIKKASEQDNYRIAVQRNRWAQGQTVVYWFAPNRSELLKTIAKDYERVMNIFNEADTKMYLKQIYIAGQNIKANKIIDKNFDVSIKIPKAYTVAHEEENAIWMRKETDKISSNIFLYSLPLSDTTMLGPDNHKKLRNQLTKKYFSTHIEDSYMQIDDRVLPIYYQEMHFANQPTLQARGLWGMVNDFMGGSFVTYMIEDRANNRVLLLDGFVHAPGQKKRPELRKLDMIFTTFEIN